MLFDIGLFYLGSWFWDLLLVTALLFGLSVLFLKIKAGGKSGDNIFASLFTLLIIFGELTFLLFIAAACHWLLKN